MSRSPTEGRKGAKPVDRDRLFYVHRKMKTGRTEGYVGIITLDGVLRPQIGKEFPQSRKWGLVQNEFLDIRKGVEIKPISGDRKSAVSAVLKLEQRDRAVTY